jgi:hypothetical protein
MAKGWPQRPQTRRRVRGVIAGGRGSSCTDRSVEWDRLDEPKNIIHASAKPYLTCHGFVFVDWKREAVPFPVEQGVTGLVDVVCNLSTIGRSPLLTQSKCGPNVSLAMSSAIL